MPRTSKMNMSYKEQISKRQTLTGDSSIRQDIYHIIKHLKQRHVLNNYKTLTKKQKEDLQGRLREALTRSQPVLDRLPFAGFHFLPADPEKPVRRVEKGVEGDGPGHQAVLGLPEVRADPPQKGRFPGRVHRATRQNQKQKPEFVRECQHRREVHDHELQKGGPRAEHAPEHRPGRARHVRRGDREHRWAAG